MSFLDIFRVSEIKKERDKLALEVAQINKEKKELECTIHDLGVRDLLTIKNKIIELEDVSEKHFQSIKEKELTLELLEEEISTKNGEIIVLDEKILLEIFVLYTPNYCFTTSTEYKARLDAIRAQQKLMIKIGLAVEAKDSWYVNNSLVDGKKLVHDMEKLILRSFNNECDYCIDNVRFNNIEASIKRIQKSFDTLNKLSRVMSASVTNEYYESKVEELKLAYEYHLKKQEEKEEAKRIKEELKEQQKLEQEIRAARDKILKERKHYNQAIKDLEQKLAKAQDPEEKANIEAKLSEVSEQLSGLDNEEKLIDYREQNAKAGYVYIISNIGSFGKNVFKIGMTRRLEPMDRVDELGDASVPFTFDVHSLIFSENAPALEAKLHDHFTKNRVNKINNRKEFFYAELSEIEEVVKQNFNNVVEFIHEPPAEQYRESLIVSE